MPRLIVQLAALVCCTACATDRIGDIGPSFFGHYELVSPADREAILATARPRVEALMPGARIISVKIFPGGREIYATFARDWSGPSGGLDMEKQRGRWRIAIENKPQ